MRTFTSLNSKFPLFLYFSEFFLLEIRSRLANCPGNFPEPPKTGTSISRHPDFNQENQDRFHVFASRIPEFFKGFHLP
jgi:hypothetical protein